MILLMYQYVYVHVPINYGRVVMSVSIQSAFDAVVDGIWLEICCSFMLSWIT